MKKTITTAAAIVLLCCARSSQAQDFNSKLPHTVANVELVRNSRNDAQTMCNKSKATIAVLQDRLDQDKKKDYATRDEREKVIYNDNIFILTEQQRLQAAEDLLAQYKKWLDDFSK